MEKADQVSGRTDMKILAVDDEWNQLGLLKRSITEAIPDCELHCCQNPVLALAWVKENEENAPDIAFLDINMPVMTGIMLGKELKKLNPKVNLIFVTGFYEDYVMEAVPLHFSGYLQKPAAAEAVAQEMDNLRYPLPQPEPGKLLQIHCFGDFEIFYDGEVVNFSKKKTKELIAYLIDRKGARVNGNAICSTIYEDSLNADNSKSDLRKCVADLRKTLKAIGAEAVFIKGFDSYAIDPKLVECDFYDWEKNVPYAIRAFRGEYMSQYSWAEETLGNLYQHE